MSVVVAIASTLAAGALMWGLGRVPWKLVRKGGLGVLWGCRRGARRAWLWLRYVVKGCWEGMEVEHGE